MTADAARVEGRPMSELKAIVAASHARLDRIGDAWNGLTDEQQEALAQDAEAMQSENEAEDPS